MNPRMLSSGGLYIFRIILLTLRPLISVINITHDKSIAVFKVAAVLESHVGKNQAREKGLYGCKADKTAAEQRRETQNESRLQIGEQYRNEQENRDQSQHCGTAAKETERLIIPVKLYDRAYDFKTIGKSI